MESPAVLVVEDDRALASMLERLLVEEGYAVDLAHDGHRGLHLGLTRRYAVLVLDRGLPAVDGLDLLARLRSRGVATPVLVLSALGNPADRVAGLDAGAEDYLGKPFDVDELLARLRALRRRHAELARVLAVPGGRLDLDTRSVELAARPTMVFTRTELLRQVFTEAESTAVVDSYVHYLRRKLGRGVVDTVHGRGYQLGRP